MTRTLTRLSPHFTAEEFSCRCCRRVNVEPRLIEALELLRRTLGGTPIRVLSGSRCWKHNRAVGGAPASRHLIENAAGEQRRSDAADIVADRRTLRELYQAAEGVVAFRDGGIGVYPEHGFVHVDVREGRARWAVPVRGARPTTIPKWWSADA